jgi:hypothetical protein
MFSACTQDHDDIVFLAFVIRILIAEKVLKSQENNVGFEVDSVAMGQLSLILVNGYAVIKHNSVSFRCYILIIKLHVSAGSGHHQVFSNTYLTH